MSRIRRGDDSGVYAILYALLLLALLGMAAIVVDLGALRQNRRQTRLAADSAAVAGARELDLVGGTANPREACVEALDYLGTNLGETFPTAGCNTLPTTVPACPLSVAEPRPSSTAGDYTAVITWPVLDSSTLLTEPDVKPAVSGVTDQAVDPEVDGSDPCARIGVTVQETRDPAFAGVFGSGQTSTVVTSVARSTSNPGVGGPIAALNVLEQTDCQAIVTGGQAAIEILAVGDRPGIIAVESSGTESNGACPNNRPWVIDAAFNASGGHIWANSPAGTGLGTIMSFALNTSPLGNPLQAYNPLTPPANLLLPKPTLMSQRFGATPVTDIFDCKGTCTGDHTQYVTALETAIGGGNSLPGAYPNAPAPYDTQTFRTVDSTTVPGWPGCTIGVGDAINVPAGNWYVPCATLRIQGILVFQGGTVVTRGGIDVAAGCFSMNVPIGTATCPTVTSTGEVSPAGTSEGILYLRGGSFTKGSQASLFTEKTFVYMASGAIGFGGGGSGILYLTNPRPDPTSCDTDCQASRFGKVALWNESTSTQSIGGAAGITLRGILFVPNATFTYAGQGVQVQTNAQFWANKIEMTGQGTLKMAPDPTDSVERPELSTALIR